MQRGEAFDSDEMIAAVRGFVTAVVEGEPLPASQLAAGLDAVACAYHQTPMVAPQGQDQAAPEPDLRRLADLLRDRYPDLGAYVVTAPIGPWRGEVVTSDAISDLADVIGELGKVVWRAETLGLDEARWYFRTSYETYWGRRLCDLRSYLHGRMFEAT